MEVLHYMAPAECPYTLDGANLTTLRRARLHVVARSLGLDFSPQATKQELLQRIVVTLHQRGAGREIVAVKQRDGVRLFDGVGRAGGEDQR
jgi:hypothetical protein